LPFDARRGGPFRAVAAVSGPKSSRSKLANAFSSTGSLGDGKTHGHRHSSLRATDGPGGHV